MGSIGRLAFLAGIVLAVILGIIAGAIVSIAAAIGSVVVLVLIVLGLIVGFANIREAHTSEFLIAVIAVATVGIITVQQSSQLVPVIAPIITAIFQNIVAFAAPSALIVGLKQIWSLGYSKSK